MSRLLLSALLLLAFSGCSMPQFSVSALPVFPTPPDNLMTPARSLTPVLWPSALSKTTEPAKPTPSS